MTVLTKVWMLISKIIYSGETAAWATAIGTLVLAFVAVFQDKIRYWLTRPKLKLEIQSSPPDCMRTAFRQNVANYDPNTGQRYERQIEIPCYYFRLRVTNEGNCEAREVEIFAKDLKKHHERKSEFEPVSRFAPMNLLWSNVRKPFLPILSPQIPKHCDLAHVVHPHRKQAMPHVLPDVPSDQCVLILDLEVEPNSCGHLLEPGFYRLTLMLAAANAPPREYLLDMRITGDWYEDEARMLAEGVRLHLK
jgi:hypothetical protein